MSQAFPSIVLSHSYGECFSCRLLGALALPLVLIYPIEELLSDQINLPNFSVLTFNF